MVYLVWVPDRLALVGAVVVVVEEVVLPEAEELVVAAGLEAAALYPL